mmetsp:Transcript_27320/g.32031  ORF Transcript_27320/g.32031 Transcript_27320/m.32031 type:complete len:87 (-) Transcript_27320:973-1233(-)
MAAPSVKKPQRSVTVAKKKEVSKKAVKPAIAASRSKSKSPVKSTLRKRDQKAARKQETKLAKAKRSVSVVPRIRSKSLAKSATKPQ